MKLEDLVCAEVLGKSGPWKCGAGRRRKNCNKWELVFVGARAGLERKAND